MLFGRRLRIAKAALLPSGPVCNDEFCPRQRDSKEMCVVVPASHSATAIHSKYQWCLVIEKRAKRFFDHSVFSVVGRLS